MRREDLDEPWKVENMGRSLAMLSPGEPGLSRDDAMLVLELLTEHMEERPDHSVTRSDHSIVTRSKDA